MQTPERRRQTNSRWGLSRHRWLITLSLAFLIISAAIGAKAGDEPAGNPGPGDEHANEQGAATEEAAESTVGNYRLSPGDKLTIAVFDEPQLSGEFIIDGDGSVLLPLAGPVNLNSLTLLEAQKLIHDRFAESVIVQPAVSVRITEYRPIFVTGRVRKPGSYALVLGETVKAAIAAAGGEGLPIEQPLSVAVADFIAAKHRIRQLESDRVSLLMRKARLEAQRDGRENFIMPLLVGLDRRNVHFDHAYLAESDTFSRLVGKREEQIRALQEQRPRIQDEIDAVTDQIAKQQQRLDIVNSHLADLELLFGKGLLRKEVLLNQQIEKSLVEAQVSNLQAQVARLRQTMGDVEVKLIDLKANFERLTLGELQETIQRLREVETGIGPARKLVEFRAEAASVDPDEELEYTLSVSRVRTGRMVTVDATYETMLLPGDVVEVKLNREAAGRSRFFSTEVMQELSSPSSFSEGTQ